MNVVPPAERMFTDGSPELAIVKRLAARAEEILLLVLPDMAKLADRHELWQRVEQNREQGAAAPSQASDEHDSLPGTASALVQTRPCQPVDHG
jgi:hypothetical protein